MADPVSRPVAIPEMRVDECEECDDDATEASQRSLLTSLASSTGGGTIRMEGWLNHITSSYKNNTASNANTTSTNASLATAVPSTATAASSTPVSSSTSSKLSKTVTKKTMNKCPRYFVLRGSTLSYYSRRHDVKAKGTFVLTRGCTVGPVVFGSLEDMPNSNTTSATTTVDSSITSKSSKKKARQFYCVQLAWPINNKPSRDEQVIAQVKAQVAAESENAVLQQKQLKLLHQLELQEMLPLVEENGSVAGSTGGGGNSVLDGGGAGTKSPMLWPKQLIRRVKSESSGSPRQGIREAKIFQERSLPFLPNGEVDGNGSSHQQECDHDVGGEQLHPTLLFPSSTFQSPTGNHSQHRRNITELPASGTAPSQQQLMHPESTTKHINPSSHDIHEFGPHKHYKTQIEKQTRDQQKSAEEMQKVQQLLSQEASHQKTRKRVIQGTKVAAVSTAAITAGVLTAGVGLAAGLVFVGVTAAAGGSGAVMGSRVLDRARGKYFHHHSQKSFHLIIGAATYEEAMQWKKAMEHVIKELVDESNESAGEVGEEWRVKKVSSGGEKNAEDAGGGATAAALAHSMSSNGVSGGIAINDVREKVMHHDIMTPKWVPIQGGGMALWGILGALGGGGGNLRIFREELSGGCGGDGGGASTYNPYSLYSAPWLFTQPTNSTFPTIPRFRSDIGLAGHPFPPFKASVTLKSNSLDAFMCLMCNARIHNDEYVNYNGVSGRVPMPNSGQIASFRIIESMDDHTDVIHLVFRPLYLFPSWTAPRDFVMYRFWKYDDDGTYQICLDSVQHRDCPPVPGYVRGDMHSVYTIAPLKWKKSRGPIDGGTAGAVSASASHASRPNMMNEECLLSHVVQVDPRGWVPTTSSIPFFRNQGYGDAFAIMALHQMLDVKETLDKIRFVSVPIDGTQSTTSGGSHRGRSKTKRSTKHCDNRQVVDSGGTLGRGNRRAFPKLERSNSDLLASAVESSNGGQREQNIFVPALYRTDSADITDDDADYDFNNSRVRELYAADVYHQSSSSTKTLNVGIESSSNKDSTSMMTPIQCIPPPTRRDWWAEPDANSFRVRGKTYKVDNRKIIAGSSIFRLLAADVIETDAPIMGMCLHPKERVQLALQRERESPATSDMPAYVFCVNIAMPGPPNYHLVFYYSVDDMSKIDGSDGTPHSKLCNEFFFGNDDTFRDNTFKLIPQIIEGNFMVRKAVGSTPAIMGNKIKQSYIQGERYFELMIDTGSSSVANGVMRICNGYAKMIVVDLAFLFEGYNEETLPERLLGTVRLKNVEFGKKLRFVESDE